MARSLKIDPCSEADLESYNADRRQICEDVAGSIRIRYFTALDDDTVKQSRFSVLDPRRWPKKDADALLSHGNVQISQLIHTYRAFFQNPNGTSVPGELVLSQWKQMKKLIASDTSLSRMKFNELWPLMLDGYAQQFKFILRLVGPFFWLVFFSLFWGVVFLILLLYLAIFHQSNTNRFSPGILISTVSSVEALIFCLKPTGSFLP